MPLIFPLKKVRAFSNKGHTDRNNGATYHAKPVTYGHNSPLDNPLERSSALARRPSQS